jgi:hypothetical protein
MNWIQRMSSKYASPFMLATLAVVAAGMWLSQVRATPREATAVGTALPQTHAEALPAGTPATLDLVLVKDIPADAVDDDVVFMASTQAPHCKYVGHIHRATSFAPGDLVPDTRWALIVTEREDCQTRVYATLPLPYQGMVVSKEPVANGAIFLRAGTLIVAAAIDIHDPKYQHEVGKTCIGDWRPYALSSTGEPLECASGDWKIAAPGKRPPA